MQKKISLLLNFVLILAVAILYYLHFSGTRDAIEADSEEDTVVTDQAAIPDMPIYFVNTDSLTLNYDYALDLDKRLKKMQDQTERRFEAEARKFEKAVKEFQENARFMTQEDGKKRQEELIMKERELGRLEQELSSKLIEDQEKLNKELRERILSHIRNSRKNRNFSYILGYSSTENNILVANDSLDITRDILDGLNAAYRKDQQNKEKKEK